MGLPERSAIHASSRAVAATLGVAAPLVFAALIVQPTARASEDAAVLRVVGLGGTGIFHALDAWWAAPLLVVPIGAIETRAALASAVAMALLGALAFALAERALAKVAPRTPVLAIVLCAVAAALATLHFPARVEACAIGGTALGALLAAAPLWLVVTGATRARVAVVLGLAATYDIPVFASAVLGVAATLAIDGSLRRQARAVGRAAPWMLVGLAPVGWTLWRRAAEPRVSLDQAAFAGWLGDTSLRAEHGATSALALVRGELGPIGVALAVGGVFVLLRGRPTRPLGAGLAAIAACGLLFTGLGGGAAGVHAGPERFGGGVLAAFAAVAVFVVCGMAALVHAVSQAKVPFARASATMIVLLELALPVRVADDASLALTKWPHGTTETWTAAGWGSLPFDTVLLLPSARLLLRARAAAATGELRDDVAVLATRTASDRATARELGAEPRLAPLLRDLALYGAPEEYSLSQLAAARPLLLVFDAHWDKRFARHLVPSGLFDRYFVEPRGPNDRTHALASLEESAVRAIDADPTLSRATGELLRARALAAAAAGERDYVAATVAELDRIQPHDTVGVELLTRIATSHGGVDVRDLAERSSP